jgi:excisionase family DNA binding protein
MKESDGSSRNVTRQAYSIKEICTSLGVSKGFLKGQIKAGILPARRLGRRVIILAEDFRRYLEQA